MKKVGKYLMVRVHAGLGNRMRALASGRRLAKKTGRILLLHWPMDSYHFLCPWERLFRNGPIMVSDEVLYGEPFVEYHRISKEPTVISTTSSANVIHVWEENFFYCDSDSNRMWGQYGPVGRKEPYVAELGAELAALEFVPYIEREVESFLISSLPGSLSERPVGIHVRREDNVWSNANCTDRHFIQEIALSNERHFLVSTDSPGILDVFRKEFPRKHFYHRRSRSLERGASIEAGEDALIDMLMLSKTKRIIRSCSSSFSQVAAWIGNLPTTDVGIREHDH